MRRFLILSLGVALALAGTSHAEERPQTAAPVATPSAPSCGVGHVAVLLDAGRWGCTHIQPDAMPMAAAKAASTPATAKVKCYGDGTTGPRIQMIYGYAEGQPNRSATVIKQVRTIIAPRMQAVINAQSHGKDLGLRFLWTKGCKAIDVKVIKFPRSIQQTEKPGDPAQQITSIAKQLDKLGHNRQDRKYQVLWDGWAKGACGIAIYAQGPVQAATSSTPYNRWADGLPSLGARTSPGTVTDLLPVDPLLVREYSVVFNHAGSPKGPTCFLTKTKSTVTVELHELFHNLGAVQDDAPHADRGHCTDAPSVMCSGGGVPGYGGDTNIKACSKVLVETLDCGEDDYWNPNPPADSYLATHLNIAKSQFFGPNAADSLASSPV